MHWFSSLIAYCCFDRMKCWQYIVCQYIHIVYYSSRPTKFLNSVSCCLFERGSSTPFLPTLLVVLLFTFLFLGVRRLVEVSQEEGFYVNLMNYHRQIEIKIVDRQREGEGRYSDRKNREQSTHKKKTRRQTSFFSKIEQTFSPQNNAKGRRPFRIFCKGKFTIGKLLIMTECLNINAHTFSLDFLLSDFLYFPLL